MSGIDSKEYLESARELTRFRFDKWSVRPPGYPLFIALAGSAEKPSRLLFFISLGLHFLSIVGMSRVLASLAVPGRVIFSFSLILLMPLYTAHTAFVMAETLSEFLLCFGFWGLWSGLTQDRKGLTGLASLLLAASGLVRPTYQLLPVLLAIALLKIAFFSQDFKIKKKCLVRTAFILAAVMVLVHGAFSLWNFSKSGYLGITPRLGIDLTTRTVDYLERLPEDYRDIREFLIEKRDVQLVRRGSSHTGTQTLFNKQVWRELKEKTGLNDLSLELYLTRLNLLLIKSEPLHYLHAVGKAFISYGFPAIQPGLKMDRGFSQLFWSLFHFGALALFLAQLLVFGGQGVMALGERFLGIRRKFFVRDPERKTAYLLAFVIVFYNAVISCAVNVGDPRHRVPSDIFIVFLTVLGFSLIFEVLNQKRQAVL